MTSNKNKVSKQRKTRPPTSRRTEAPVASSSAFHQTNPKMDFSSDGVVRIRHKEFFSVINSEFTAATSGATGNTVWAWTIQPGYQSIFPWLSVIATRFEKYRCKKLTFSYRHRVPSLTPGSIVICVDQDPLDPLPLETEEGRITLLTHQGAVTKSTWEDMDMSCPHFLAGERFTRSDDDPLSVDPRFADLGVLFVGLYGVENAKVFGDLIVSYEFDFFLPQYQPIQTNPATPIDTGDLRYQSVSLDYDPWVKNDTAQETLDVHVGNMVFPIDPVESVSSQPFNATARANLYGSMSDHFSLSDEKVVLDGEVDPHYAIKYDGPVPYQGTFMATGSMQGFLAPSAGAVTAGPSPYIDMATQAMHAHSCGAYFDVYSKNSYGVYVKKSVFGLLLEMMTSWVDAGGVNAQLSFYLRGVVKLLRGDIFVIHSNFGSIPVSGASSWNALAGFAMVFLGIHQHAIAPDRHDRPCLLYKGIDQRALSVGKCTSGSTQARPVSKPRPNAPCTVK